MYGRIFLSLCFLAMGLTLDLGALIGAAGWIVLLFAATVILRASVTYGLGGLDFRLRGRGAWSWLHILVWGSPRGTISLALVLGAFTSDAILPAQQRTVETVVYGAVLLSLLVQGLSLPRCLRYLGLVREHPAELRLQEERGRGLLASSALAGLQALEERGEARSSELAEWKASLETERERARSTVEAILEEDPELRAAEKRQAIAGLLDDQRRAIAAARRRGSISDEAAQTLTKEIDLHSLSSTLPGAADRADETDHG